MPRGRVDRASPTGCGHRPGRSESAASADVGQLPVLGREHVVACRTLGRACWARSRRWPCGSRPRVAPSPVPSARLRATVRFQAVGASRPSRSQANGSGRSAIVRGSAIHRLSQLDGDRSHPSSVNGTCERSSTNGQRRLSGVSRSRFAYAIGSSTSRLCASAPSSNCSCDRPGRRRRRIFSSAAAPQRDHRLPERRRHQRVRLVVGEHRGTLRRRVEDAVAARQPGAVGEHPHQHAGGVGLDHLVQRAHARAGDAGQHAIGMAVQHLLAPRATGEGRAPGHNDTCPPRLPRPPRPARSDRHRLAPGRGWRCARRARRRRAHDTRAAVRGTGSR